MTKSKHMQARLWCIALLSCFFGCVSFALWYLVPYKNTLDENWIFIDGWMFRVPVFTFGCLRFMRAFVIVADEIA